jgi:hypothetical protein
MNVKTLNILAMKLVILDANHSSTILDGELDFETLPRCIVLL